MVPTSMHQVLTACGIRDASASIEGSREAVSVMKCVLQMLHGGVSGPFPIHAPLGMSRAEY